LTMHVWLIKLEHLKSQKSKVIRKHVWLAEGTN
jgi:hypothetical protein